MGTDDPLYRAFLTEMEALEKFRITYTGLHPSAPLHREDPDVRRLIEALAMFTARTRRAGERALNASMMRVFRQHFPYILSPMPAMGMLRAVPDARFVDVARVPKGSTVNLMPTQAEGAGAARPLVWRTLGTLRILPVELEGVDIFKREQQGQFRMLFRFASAHPRPDEVGELSLYVNHLNDFVSSLTVQHALQSHLVACSVVFDEPVGAQTEGSPCEVHFGAPRTRPSELEAFEHPLQRARTFFHCPEQEMFLNVKVQGQPRGEWRSFTICMDLDASWPTTLRLSPETFQLHVVPMVNISRDMSSPIECDGTRERYAIHHSDAGQGYRLHSVAGVYRLDPDEGMIPLRPGVVGDERDAYEVEFEGGGARRHAYAVLDFPAAFAEPFRVAVDAFWHQPILEPDSEVEWRPALVDRYLDGLGMECATSLRIGRDNGLGDKLEAALHLLSIKNQRLLGEDDLVFLLGALGALEDRHFREIAQSISAVEVTSKPFARGASGFKYVYAVTYRRLDQAELPMLGLFNKKLLEVLQVWSAEEVVELVALVPSLEHRADYR